MIRLSFSGLFKFLIGILLVQVATGILVVVAMRMENPELWILFGLLALTLCLISAFWFTSIITHAKQDAVAQIREDFSREREKIRVRAERSLPPGRSRYTCTAPAPHRAGAYYWYSHLFIAPRDDGTWPDE